MIVGVSRRDKYIFRDPIEKIFLIFVAELVLTP